MNHAWLGLDPGITTGFVALDDDGRLIATTVWGTAELENALDAVIRQANTADTRLTVVVEAMPSVGRMGALAKKLEAVRKVIYAVLHTYDVRIIEIAPGEWKPSRVAKTIVVPRKFNETPLMIHQKDAMKMTAYAISKGA